jgi:hypothetical protein
VPGYRAASLALSKGRENLGKFVEACHTYEKAVLGDETENAAKAGSEGASASPEKDAFESAKELGTIAAFEAFLSNYPSDFYADLARAYVDKLKAADKADEGEENDTAAPPAPSPKP